MKEYKTITYECLECGWQSTDHIKRLLCPLCFERLATPPESVEEAVKHAALKFAEQYKSDINRESLAMFSFRAGAKWDALQHQIDYKSFGNAILEKVKELLPYHNDEYERYSVMDKIMAIRFEFDDLALQTGAQWASRQGQWVDVKDRLPENEQIIDTWNGVANRRAKYMLGVFYRHIDINETDRVLHCSYPDITHWQPLPKSPK
ncbi:MAG TPA: DUF551 domain-containing protein [Bacteroidia bacterium]|nr:DUF551 domain-containing protein [Bacteroidia bacterium]